MCVSASLLCQCVTGTKKKLQCVFVCVLVRRQPDEDSLAHLLLSLAVGGRYLRQHRCTACLQ